MFDTVPFIKWIGSNLDEVVLDLARRYGPNVLDWLQSVVDAAIQSAKQKLQDENAATPS